MRYLKDLNATRKTKISLETYLKVFERCVMDTLYRDEIHATSTKKSPLNISSMLGYDISRAVLVGRKATVIVLRKSRPTTSPPPHSALTKSHFSSDLMSRNQDERRSGEVQNHCSLHPRGVPSPPALR